MIHVAFLKFLYYYIFALFVILHMHHCIMEIRIKGLADHYYGSRKSWIPEKNVEKLRSLIRQREQRSSFLKILE